MNIRKQYKWSKFWLKNKKNTQRIIYMFNFEQRINYFWLPKFMLPGLETHYIQIEKNMWVDKYWESLLEKKTQEEKIEWFNKKWIAIEKDLENNNEN